MEITSIQLRDTTVVNVYGDLDSTTSDEAATRLGAEIQGGHIHLVLNMAGVTYLSSAGLRVILDALRGARDAGGDLRFAGARGNIRRVLEVSGFLGFIKAFPTVEEAAVSYNS